MSSETKKSGPRHRQRADDMNTQGECHVKMGVGGAVKPRSSEDCQPHHRLRRGKEGSPADTSISDLEPPEL